MVLFSLGLPGRFGDWCDAVTQRLAEAALGSVVTIVANTPEELATALIAEEGSSFLVIGRQPSGWLRRILATTNKPFILSMDDPQVATWELVSRNGLELADAARRVSCGCVLVKSCTALSRALVMRADRDWHQPSATAAAIANHLGLPVDLADVERAVAELAGLGAEGDPPSSDASQPDETALAVISGAVAPYFGHLAGGALEPITWSRELFLADGNLPATHAVDITGRVRALIWGPYINLPPGNWAAEIVLGFSHEVSEMNFIVDVLIAGSQVSVTNIRPLKPGVFSVNLSFLIGEENDHPVEFRVVNERAAFDGRVMLGHVMLIRQDDTSREAVEPLTTELGLS